MKPSFISIYMIYSPQDGRKNNILYSSSKPLLFANTCVSTSIQCMLSQTFTKIQNNYYYLNTISDYKYKTHLIVFHTQCSITFIGHCDGSTTINNLLLLNICKHIN